MEIGNQIKLHRAALNLSQEELAEQVYVTRQTLSNWENGKTYPDINSLLRLSGVFGVTLDELVKGMKWKIEERYDCIHNYIRRGSSGELLIRKGAISAEKDEKVIIPVNMRDGIILGIGKGNADWNCSAPHGAGRIGSREIIRSTYTVSQYKKEMKGIYSTCIGKETLDEAPFAYRSLEYIKDAIKETISIREMLHPVYNFKAGGKA